MSNQRYVTEELTHCLGAKCPSDGDRYELLRRILREDQFLVCAKDRDIATDPRRSVTVRRLRVHRQDYSSNNAFSGTYVCFCDIPLADLGIHMRKYSRFGIAFSKAFLASQGATPVFYVVSTSCMGEHYITRGEWYDRIQDSLNKVGSLESDQAGAELAEVLDDLLDNLDEVFSFLKFFDPSAKMDDASHYYMEREWRVVGVVRFALCDVRRIILPEEYAKRFRADFPDYFGQLTFSPQADAG